MTNSNEVKNYVYKALLSLSLFFPALAFAHHPLDGMMPTSFSQGLLSGIGHPIIGLDHLAFVVAAGILAWQLGRPLALLSSFIAATAIGSLVVSFGAAFSFKEPLILASVAVIGLTLIRRKVLEDKLSITLYALSGLLHGSAYGEAVVGAEATPIVAYLIGFALIQFAIAFAAAQSLKLLTTSKEESLQYARIVGAIVFGVAATYGFEMAESAIFADA